MTYNHTAPVLVTIIVPTIGRPEFIIDTLRSVLAQTYTQLQILVSDNAPVAPTAPLLAAAGIDDARIEIVQRTERLDFSTHMNDCIAQSRGSYLMIVSDDDQITPDYVAEMLDMMSADSQIKVCLGRQTQISENDRGVLPDLVRRNPQQILEGVEFLSGTLTRTLDTGLMTYISMFVRRCDVVEVGGFKSYPDGSHADNFIVFKLALSGRVALASSQLFYRVYLASSGLRTPFSALLAATCAYTRDANAALQTAPVSVEQRRKLRNLLRAANTRLLVSRVRVVYRHRLSPFELFMCLLKVMQFRFERHPS